MRSVAFVFCLGLCLIFSGCGPTRQQQPPPAQSARLTVAVAASMRPAFEEIAAAFRKARPEITLTPSYGASGNFFAQLLQQAPFDLFLSADAGYPERLVTTGHAEASFTYATGRLVLWARRESGLHVATRGMASLQDPRLTRIAIANPELAPYGRAAIAALAHYDLAEAVRGKLALAENVGQAAQFVQSGAATIGVFAYALTFAPALQEAGDFHLLPATAHPVIAQDGVIPVTCRDRAAAEALRDYLLGPEGQAILRHHGFGPP